MADLWSWLGGIGKDLGKKFEGAVAQINPFDNGADYNSVVNNAQPRIPQSPQPAPQQIKASQPPKPNIDINANSNLSQSVVNKMNPQVQANLQKSQSMVDQSKADVWNPGKIAGDILNAGGQAANAVKDAAVSTAEGFYKPIETLGTGVGNAIAELNGTNAEIQKQNDQARQQTQDITTKLGQQIQRTTDPTTRQRLQAGIDRINAIQDKQNQNEQSFYQSQLNATDPRKNIVAAGETALNLATAGKGADLLQGGKLGLNTVVNLPVAKQLVKNAAATTAQGAGIGAGYAGLETAKDPNATPQDYAKNITQGGAVGGALGLGSEVALPVAGMALNSVISHVRSLPNEIRTTTLKNATAATPSTSVPVGKLTSYEGAPDRARVDQYKQQIQSGQPIEPLIAMRDSSGKLGVEDGKHRLQALKELGIRNAPVKIATPDNLRAAAQGGYIKVPGISDKMDQSTPVATDIPQKPITNAMDNPIKGFTPEELANQPVGQQRGFVGTVKGSAEVTPNAKRMTSGQYQTRNTQQMYSQSQEFASGDLNKATENVKSRINVKTGTINDQTVSDAIATAKANDAKGNHQAASDIYERLAEHLTKSGQTIQAASLLNNMTPEGLQYRGIRQLKKAGVEITPELQNKIKSSIDEIKKYSPGTSEHDYAVSAYSKFIGDNLPSDRADKLTSLWKAGLLTGIRTQTGNALSNATFAGLHTISDPLAAAIDKAIGAVTGQRTKTFTLKGKASGTAEGIQKGAKYLKTGVDELNNSSVLGKNTNKFDSGEIEFKNKALNVYVNGVFRMMGAADKPFRYAQLRNSLYDLAKADAKTKGLKGKELRDHINEFIVNPPKDALQTATDEAAKSVLANDTFLSNAAARLRGATESIQNPAGKFIAKAGTAALAPFTKVPSAFFSRVFDFTPVGAIKEVVSQISKKQLDQRALATALSEATTGTAIMFIGAELANNGLISGEYPNDPKEQQRWKAQGIQPNSIRVGNQWLSLNYFGPLGALFSQGKRAHDTLATGGNPIDVGANFLSGGAQDALGQTFLQGVSGALDAINDPQRYAQNFVKNQAGSVIPTISNDIATAMDPLQRQTNNSLEAVQSRIPVLRQGLNPQQDVYGNQLARKSSALDTLINPLRPSNAISNDVTSEVERLHNVDPNNKDLQVTPTTIDKNITINKEKVPLNDQQVYDLQTRVGQATQAAWSKLIQTPAYQALDDTQKASALNKLRTDITAATEAQYAKENAMGAKKLTARQQSLLGGNTSMSNYTQSGKGGVTVSDNLDPQSAAILTNYNGLTPKERTDLFSNQNDAEYQYNLAKYNNDKANGSVSEIQDITRQKQLAKDQVGSQYSKTVRDLYGLSKSDLASYMSTSHEGVDNQQVASDLISYDQALYNSGLASSLKYKTGLTSSKKSGGKSKKAKSSKNTQDAAARSLAYKSRVPTVSKPNLSKPSPVSTAKLSKTNLKKFTPRLPSKPKLVAR